RDMQDLILSLYILWPYRWGIQFTGDRDSYRLCHRTHTLHKERKVVWHRHSAWIECLWSSIASYINQLRAGEGKKGYAWVLRQPSRNRQSVIIGDQSNQGTRLYLPLDRRWW